MVLESYWDCTLRMQGDYVVYYNEWGRAIGLFQAIGERQQEQIREDRKRSELAGIKLNTGRILNHG